MATLDTTFLIDLDRGFPSALDCHKRLVESGAQLLIPAHAAMEYLAGYEDPTLNLKDLERSFRLVPFGRNHLIQSAKIARKAHQSGNFPGWGDAAVASTAVLEGDLVVTANPGHFRVFGCQVWDYRNEEAPPNEE